MSNIQTPCINLVTTIGEGFYQSKKCQYYNGTSPELTVGRGRSGLIVLSNADCSDKIVYLNKITLANYSSAPISLQVYSDVDIDRKLSASCDIAPTNSKCNNNNINNISNNTTSSNCTSSSNNTSNNNKRSLDILYSNDVSIDDGTLVYQRSLGAYDSSDSAPNGSIILCPGSERAYIINTLCPLSTAVVTLSFAWWESPIY